MNRLLLNVLLALVLTGLCSCSILDHTSNKDHSGVIKLDDSEKALGIYAQGLLLLEEDPSEGLKLLVEAMYFDPYERRYINDYSSQLLSKVHRESTLDAKISDHEVLHREFIKTFSMLLQRHPGANYIRLKLIESYLALEKHVEAERLLQEKGLIEDDSLLLARIRLYKALKHPAYIKQFKPILENPEYATDIQLNLTAIRSLMESSPLTYSEELLAHSRALIKGLIDFEGELPRDIAFSLIDAVLYGSDIGETARSQSIESLDYGDQRAQWSLLAGILIKLEMYEEAYTVIKYKVLNNDNLQWRALLNLAICCQKTDRDSERIKYLELAYQLKPESIYTAKSLLIAHISEGDPQRALEIYAGLKSENDFWLQKIYFYLLVETKKYKSAFELAERLFEWPDTAKRVTGISSSFASSIVPVYLKAGRPQLMEKRIAQSLKYLPDDVSLLNSLAYQFAEHDYKLPQAEIWIKKVYELTEVNSAFADTYAWVLYKLGRYKEAKEEIDLALSLERKGSAEILLHAGDIYLKLGYDRKAKEFWEKSLSENAEYKSKVESRLKNLE